MQSAQPSRTSKQSTALRFSLPAAVLLLTAICLCSRAKADEPASFPGKVSDWNGYARYDFEVDGKPVLVVAPKEAAAGRPWVWHGEFFGHKPAPDIALLGAGFHIVYMRVPNMLGSPRAVQHWNVFYQELTNKYGFAKKAALVGLSRGGLYCYNWAAANPDKVACIYGDAPVCDFKSWPGGKGRGPGSTRDWQLVLETYGFENEADAMAYGHNPVDNLKPLAKAGVPLLHVYGDADEVVPWDENTGLVAKHYRKLGGSIELIAKPGVGHHPHGLHDSTPIVEFIKRHGGVNSKVTARKPLDDLRRIAAQLQPSRRIVYKTIDDRELYLHVFEPADFQPTDRRPCFLTIHGGGWGGGEPSRMYPFAKHFADLGYVGISLHYRLLNAKRGVSVFECVKDGRSAVRFIRSQAAMLGIDPQKIIVSGASAGGHVAVATALFDGVDEADEANSLSCIPNALVLLYPVIDTSTEGYGNKKIGDKWRQLSPVHQVRGKVPPTIVFHGTGDTVTPFPGAKAFQKAMHDNGNRCDLDVHVDGKHGYLIFDYQLYLETLKKIEAFLSSVELTPTGN